MSLRRYAMKNRDGRVEMSWKGFSWPAFLFGPLWCLYKGMTVTAVVTFIIAFFTAPVGTLIVAIFLGCCGNEMHDHHLRSIGYYPIWGDEEVSNENESNPTNNS